VEEQFVKLRVLGLALILMLAPAAFADFSVDLTFEFSGAQSPAGPAPWVTATFASLVGGGMELTIDSSGLTGTEFIDSFFFNFDPTLTASSFVPVATTLGSHDDVKGITAKNDDQKADGSPGRFDFLIEFPTSSGSRFVDNETFVARVGVGNPAINADDFLFATSVGYYAAAHIQSIGTSGAGSGWIAGNTFNTPQGVVPEPGSIVLLSTVMLGLGLIMRKRSAARRG
jgi:hypothetical protein